MGNDGKRPTQCFRTLAQRPWSGLRQLRTLKCSLERESLTVVIDANDEVLAAAFDGHPRALRFTVPDRVRQRFMPMTGVDSGGLLTLCRPVWEKMPALVPISFQAGRLPVSLSGHCSRS